MALTKRELFIARQAYLDGARLGANYPVDEWLVNTADVLDKEASTSMSPGVDKPHRLHECTSRITQL